MDLEEATTYWRERLIVGKPIYRVRVRRLLELAGAERRGWAIMDRIQTALDEKGLETDPDFRSAWIDGLVRVRLKDADRGTIVDGCLQESEHSVRNHTDISECSADPSDVEALSSDPESRPVAEALNSPATDLGLVETAIAVNVDPVARISGIPSANRGVVSVLLTDNISAATTCMMLEGYSQLAIMQNEREVRGMISWESIAKRALFDSPPQTIADCRTDAQVIDADGSLFDALPTIERFGYVLVRSKERKITGIVTAADLSSELGQLSFAFMSLRTIELLIRANLHPRLTPADLQTLEEHSTAKGTGNTADLTFGENVRLLENPDVWGRVAGKLDKKLFIKRLLDVRDIRNEVMHFGPDPLSSKQMRSLQQMEGFLQQVFN